MKPSVSDIIFKLRHGASNGWSTTLKPEECEVVLEELGAAEPAVHADQLSVAVEGHKAGTTSSGHSTGDGMGHS